jgi:protein ImuB
MVRRQPELGKVPFVTAMPEHGRMVIKAVNRTAFAIGIQEGMVVADRRAVLPELQVFNHEPDQAEKILKALAEWCLRYTPVAAVDAPDGLILDVSGCTHLWGGEKSYLADILNKLRAFNYDVRVGMADTVGTAWAISRYGEGMPIIEPGRQLEAILPLPPVALRLDGKIIHRLHRLGLYKIDSFIRMPRAALRRRFTQTLLHRIDQALGQGIEVIESIKPILPYQERLPSFEPIRTATGIEFGLRKLIEILCARLTKEGKGLRTATFKAFRIDGIVQKIQISTGRPSRNVEHLFKLFEIKIANIAPGLGIELFLLEAPIIEDIEPAQDVLWETTNSKKEIELAELLDRIAIKMGQGSIHRYFPDEHYWPERSVKVVTSIQEQLSVKWRIGVPRPIHLLSKPEPIVVTVPIPDYPPMHFHYKGKLHNVVKADGPERIEQEWWIEDGLYRDYYCIEDEYGARYWVFRLGQYNREEPKWFIHGFFA